MNDALNESKVRNKEGRHAPTTTLPESAWQPVPTYTILVARFLLALREECSNLHSATNTLSRLSYDYSRTVATSRNGRRNASDCTKNRLRNGHCFAFQLVRPSRSDMHGGRRSHYLKLFVSM